MNMGLGLLTQSIKDPTLWSIARYPPPDHMVGENLISIQLTHHSNHCQLSDCTHHGATATRYTSDLVEQDA